MEHIADTFYKEPVIKEESINKDPNWPLPSFDAVDWAEAFNKIAQKLGYSKMDEKWLVSWFANALMRGYDEYAWKHPYLKTEWTNGYIAGIQDFKAAANPMHNHQCIQIDTEENLIENFNTACCDNVNV